MTEPGERIGNFTIERLLARTLLSEVFLAHGPGGERVCVKRLRSDLARPGSEVALSFWREATLLAEVQHPNVVRVLELGRHGGVPFTCLELIEGSSLAEEIARRQLPIPEAIDILRQIALGLTRVHERGLVHGDIKPQNVLLRRRDDLEVKLADFGLAVEAARRTSGIMGTPHYMSPEQARIVDWPVDARSDLYSLGVVGFELLTGRPPFDSPDTARLLSAHVALQPPAPRELRRDLPPLLERIVLKLLAKVPADRYRSAASLAGDLEELERRIRAGEALPEFALDAAADASGWLGQVFVGRIAELSALQSTLERVRLGRPTLTLVGGRAGVGKSTLFRELRSRVLTSGIHFASSKCYEFASGLPFYALAEAIGDHLRTVGQLPQLERDAILTRIRAAVGEQGAEVVQLVPGFATLFPDAGEPVYLGEGRDRLRFLQLLCRVLEAAAPVGAPLVLFLDDLQWADSSTLQALELAADTLQDASLLVIGAFRTEDLGPEHPLQRLLSGKSTRIPIEQVALLPFDLQSTSLLISESLRQPQAAVPASLVARVYDQTEGNPLFVIEMLRALLTTGALALRAGQLLISEERLAVTALPRSVVEVVLRRMDGLAAETRGVLGAAALIGHGLTLQLLADAAGTQAEHAFTALQEARTHKIIEVGRDETYRFCHDRIREACSRLLPAAEQAEVHRRIIAGLEAQGAGAAHDDRVFDLAEHAQRAGDAARIRTYCAAAAAWAQARYANEKALGYFRRALDAAPDRDREPQGDRALRLGMAETLDLLGRYREAEQEYAHVLQDELASIEEATVLARLARSLQQSGDYQRSQDRLLEALGLLGIRIPRGRSRIARWSGRLASAVALLVSPRRRPDRTDERTRLVAQLLNQLCLFLQIVDAKRLPDVAHRAIAAAARLGPSRELSAAHRIMTLTLAQLPRPPWKRALRHGMQAVVVARRAGAPLEAAAAALYTSDIFCWSARYREALPWLKTAREGLSLLGNMWELANAHIFSYLAYRGCGRLDDALAHAQALVELGERIQAFGTIANGHQKVADILLLRGQSAQGESHLARSLSLAEERKLNFERFQGYKIQAAARLRDGKHEDARRLYLLAIKLVETPGVSFFQAYIADTYFGYAEAFLRDRDHFAAAGGLTGEEGLRVTRWLKEWLQREKYLVGHRGYGLRVRALVEALRGRFARSRRTFLAAMELLRRQDRPIDLAAAQLDAAEILGERYPDEALGWLRRARAVLDQVGARPLVGRCDQALVRLGQAPPAGAGAEPRSNQALRELVGISQLLMQASRDPSTILDRIATASIKLLGAERGFIFTRARPGAKLELRLALTASGDPVPEAESASLSRGVIDRVDEGGEGVAVSDTELDAALRERKSVIAYQVRSVLCAPLRQGGETIGVLYLDNQVSKAVFGREELAVLRSFAAQAVVALSNAMHLRTIEEMNHDLDAKVLERTRQLETANLRLQASMDELSNTTLRLAEARRDLLQKELEVARTIQIAMVPGEEMIHLHAASFCGKMTPTNLCGGDFWSYLDLGSRLLLMIGDVTGHGVGSAMITTTAKSCLQTMWHEHADKLSLDKLMVTMNDVIYELTREHMAMTASVIEVDPERRQLRFSSAGHPPPFLIQAQGRGPAQVQQLYLRSPQLGHSRGVNFPIRSVAYSAGDRLVLITDGVIESRSTTHVEYGARRLQRLLAAHAADAPAALLATVTGDVGRFAANVPQADDVTIVVAELH